MNNAMRPIRFRFARIARAARGRAAVSSLSAISVLAALAAFGPGAVPARAADAATGTGVGIILGGPSGLTLKLPQGRGKSYNFALGYDLDGRGDWYGPGPDRGGHLYLGGDYVWYNYGVLPVEKGRLPLYYGPGAYVVVSDRSAVGIRGVVGLEYQFAGAPFDVFLELGPRLNVVPDTRGDLTAGLGGRFFF